MSVQNIDWENIVELNRLLSAQKGIEDNIKKEEVVLKAVNKSIVDAVRSIYIPYDGDLMHSAWLQSREGNYEGAAYKWAKDSILKDFFPNFENAFIERFSECGRDTYGWCFQIRCGSILFELFIPDTKKVTADNLKILEYGKYVVRYKNENESDIWVAIRKSYDISVIAKSIYEFIVGGTYNA